MSVLGLRSDVESVDVRSVMKMLMMMGNKREDSWRRLTSHIYFSCPLRLRQQLTREAPKSSDELATFRHTLSPMTTTS